MFTTGVLILVIVAISGVQSRKAFTPVELAREMSAINVSSWEIPWLVCIANHSSGLVTGYTQVSFIPFRYSEPHHGLFGIPERIMSEPSSCHSFNKTLALDDNIEDDLRCLQESLDATPAPRLKLFNKLMDQTISVSKCFDYWQQLPPCFSLENSTEPPCIDTKPTECSPDYSGYFTFLLSTLLILTLLAIIYLSSQIVKPNKPDTLGSVSLRISRKRPR